MAAPPPAAPAVAPVPEHTARFHSGVDTSAVVSVIQRLDLLPVSHRVLVVRFFINVWKKERGMEPGGGGRGRAVQGVGKWAIERE